VIGAEQQMQDNVNNAIDGNDACKIEVEVDIVNGECPSVSSSAQAKHIDVRSREAHIESNKKDSPPTEMSDFQEAQTDSEVVINTNNSIISEYPVKVHFESHC